MVGLPHISQASSLDCGPTCVRMLSTRILGEDPGRARAVEESGLLQGKVCTTLCLVVGLARLSGPSATLLFCSTAIEFNLENMKQEFYQQFNASSVKQSQSQLKEARERAVRVEERLAPLRELKGWLNASTAEQPQYLLCLLDWNVVRAFWATAAKADGCIPCFASTLCGGGGRRADGGEDAASYSGHFIIVYACRDGGFDYHDPSESSGGSHMREDVFEKARLAAGTDADVVFVRCNSSSRRSSEESGR